MPPVARPKTLRQAKADYKRYHHQITPAEQRRTERAIELDRRAEAIRQRDARRRFGVKKREELEEKETKAMRSRGIGLATQLAGNSGTQLKMKMGMESFVGYWKKNALVGEQRPETPMKTTDSKTEAEARQDLDKELEALVNLSEPASQTSSVCSDNQNHTSNSQGTARQSEPRSVSITLAYLEDDWADVVASSSQLARDLKMSGVGLSATRDSVVEELTTKERPCSKGVVLLSDEEEWETIPFAKPSNSGLERNERESLDVAKFVSTTAPSMAPTPIEQKSSYEEFGLSTQILYEAFTEDDLAFDQPLHQDQLAMRTPQKQCPQAQTPSSGSLRMRLRLHDFGLSTQILNEAFDDAAELATRDSKSNSSLGSDVFDQSSWEAAVFSKMAEVGA